MPTKTHTARLEIEVPARLMDEMQALVTAGWFRDMDEILLVALRRFLDSHGDLTERMVREDVKWGLGGAD
jgi:Arc/MetJ-type ribon-helix-helix transcriptional regulator